MYKIVSRLLIYGDMPKDTILMELADIVRKMDDKTQTKEELSTRVFTQMKHLLQVATDYGFDRNLWHNYLTFLLIAKRSGQMKEASIILPREISGLFLICFIMISPNWRSIWGLTASAGFPIIRQSGKKN